MGHPYRDPADGDASDAPPARGPFDSGPLRLPHYKLTLIPGCALMSVERGDTWVVRLEYDPARATGELDAEGCPVYELDGQPYGRFEMPPLLAAFGDPGESRSSVEHAFLDALCESWCAIVRRFTGVGGPERFSGKTYDELEYPDIWAGNRDGIDHSLLCMVETAQSLYGPTDTHYGCYVTETTKREFWKRHHGYLSHDEPTYFRLQIDEWRSETRESDPRLRLGIF